MSYLPLTNELSAFEQNSNMQLIKQSLANEFMSYLQVLSCVLVRLKNKKQEQLSALENQI
jgi:hypothetical protein